MSSKKDIDIMHKCIGDIPFVKRAVKRVLALEREKKILVDENKMLKRMVDVLLDKNTTCRCHCNTCSCNSAKFNDVKIKTEKNNNSDASTITDIEKHENIVYKIDTHSTINEVQDTVKIIVMNDKKKDVVSVDETVDENKTTKEEKEDEGLEQLVKEDESRLYLFKRLEEEEEVEVEEEEEETEEVEVEEEEEETEEEEEETEEVEVEEETEEVEVEEVEEEEEEEVYEVIINNKSYYTTNEIKGYIYAIDADEEIGEKIGEFKDGKPVFFKTKK